MIHAGLVLEGGATRGVFTAGALDYLMEKDVYFSHVVGVSAGSCNAVDYVSRQNGRTRDCMISQGKEYNYYYGLKDFVKERSMMDMDMIFDRYPNELIPFDFDTFFSSDIECEIVATNCITGKAEYLSEKSDKERLLMITRASCSMPLVCPITVVDGVPYLDGGIADSVPVKHVKEKGVEKIAVILTRPKGYRKKPTSRAMGRLYRRLYSKYPRLIRTCILRNKNYNRTMDYIEELEDKGEIFVMRPKIRPISRLEKDKEKLRAFYCHGREQMEQMLPYLVKYLDE